MSGVDDLAWGDAGAWLWGLVALALVFGFIWLAQWRQARLEALARVGPLAAQLDHRGAGWTLLRGGLIVAALALVVVGLARPRWGASETEVKALGIDVAILLDASKSMMVADVVPNRLDAARFEIHRLLDGLHGGRVALVPFAGLAYIQTPLTSDFEVVKIYLDALRVEDMPRGGTAIGRGIHEALRALAPADEDFADTEPDEYEKAITAFAGSEHKAIILISDGEDHEGEPLDAAAEAARRGVKIFTVGVGTPQGRPVLEIDEKGQVVGTVRGPDGKTPLFSELNVRLLREIADMTGGDYFHLGEEGLGDGLLDALSELEKAEYQATFASLGEERYQWPIVPALLLLVAEAWLSQRRREVPR